MTDEYVALAGEAPPLMEDISVKSSFLQESTDESKVIDFKKLLKQHR